MFQEEDLPEGFDFTDGQNTPCRIDGTGQMVYWKNCRVENWMTGHGKQPNKLLGTMGRSTGKGTLSTGEFLTFIGQDGGLGGKAKG